MKTISNFLLLFLEQIGSSESLEDSLKIWQVYQLPLSTGKCLSVKDPHGCQPEVGCCGGTFVVVATSTGCYNNKMTAQVTLSEMMFPETIILVSGFFRNRLWNLIVAK